MTPQWYSPGGDAVILHSHFKGIFSHLFFFFKAHFYSFMNRQWDTVEGTGHTAFDVLKILRTVLGLFFVLFCFFQPVTLKTKCNEFVRL